ncbi:MAG: hypothetical protein JEZ14_08745 [Marinilabiliaceae bacterium]|nr:hypothetical protein [Marinilabiliaceae bacterium]
MEAVLAIIFIFGSIPAIIIALSYFRNRCLERTALIAANKEADLFREADQKPKHYLTMKYGMLLVGLALGVLMGALIEAHTFLNEATAYFPMVLAFGGLSLVLFYVLFKDKMNAA